MTEISESMVIKIGAWNHLDQVIDKMKLIERITIQLAKREVNLEGLNVLRKINRIPRYHNILEGDEDLTDGCLDFSENKTFAKTKLVNINRSTGISIIAEIEAKRNEREYSHH